MLLCVLRHKLTHSYLCDAGGESPDALSCHVRKISAGSKISGILAAPLFVAETKSQSMNFSVRSPSAAAKQIGLGAASLIALILRQTTVYW